jgi:transposase
MRFEGLLDRQARGEITQEEAATVLGVSVRTFQRRAERYEEDGADGLKDGRLNRPSPKRAPREELERMLCLFRDKYSDFSAEDATASAHGRLPPKKLTVHELQKHDIFTR